MENKDRFIEVEGMKPEASERKRQLRRLAVALVAFFVLMPVTAGIALLLSLIAISMFVGGWDFFIAAWHDPEVAKSHDWIAYLALALAALTMVAAWYLWSRLFLRSGYLNDEMVALLKRGHLPDKAETWRRRVGYVVYGLIAGLLTVKLYFEDELMLALIPFAATVYTVVHAWRDPVWKRGAERE